MRTGLALLGSCAALGASLLACSSSSSPTAPQMAVVEAGADASASACQEPTGSYDFTGVAADDPTLCGPLADGTVDLSPEWATSHRCTRTWSSATCSLVLECTKAGSGGTSTDETHTVTVPGEGGDLADHYLLELVYASGPTEGCDYHLTLHPR